MKIIVISALAIVVLVASLGATLMIGAPFAFAQAGGDILSKHPISDMLSGYDHGVADASDPCNDPQIPCIAYVWKSPNGFINQTSEFIDGYVLGFCKVAGVNASMD